MKNKKRSRLIISLLLGLLLIWVLIFLWGKSRPKIDTFEMVTVDTTNIEKTIVATGSIQPRDEVLIKPQVSGIISEIYKETGDRVNRGDIIARIQVVPEMGMLNSAESSLNIYKLRLDRVQQEFDRTKQLYDAKVISKEEYEVKDSELSVAREEYQNSKNNLEIVKSGMMSKNTDASTTQIRATVSGIILSIPVKVGNSVIQSNTFNDGTTIASIANMSDLIFLGKVDESEVSKMKVGTIAKITIGAMQEDTLFAKMEYVSPKGIDESGVIMFEIKAAIKIPTGMFIRSGYSANAEIVSDKRENVLTIPESSVIFEDEKTYVEVLKGNPTEKQKQEFERKEIKIGLSNGIMVELLSGLDGTEKIKGNKKIEKKVVSVNID